MLKRRRSVWRGGLALVVVVCAFALPAVAADTIPASYSDAEFWRLINEFSEPNGYYQYENFVSNEISFQTALPELKRLTRPGGVYLGVGPEQNFTYIAAIEPKVAFIIDIRRQNLVELLLYKALFEMSADRADFVSRLFSRKRPEGLGANSTAADMILAFESLAPDKALYDETLAAIKDNLISKHGFKPVGDDEQKIEYVFDVFYRGGPRMNYAFASSSPNQQVPSYKWLMLVTDTRGENWAFLDAESRYQYVKEMQRKNLIVPLVGDFGGPKTLRALGQYLRGHDAVVSVFYISNVEDYIAEKWSAYVANLKALPQDDRSVLMRFITMTITQLGWMRDTPLRWPAMFTGSSAAAAALN
ncbi:MAG TPA: hypothetical protein VFY29_08905 [Terriglobia bacterium]|nr:hypothetical protein [Terriglobia bacterium]